MLGMLAIGARTLDFMAALITGSDTAAKALRAGNGAAAVSSTTGL
jgi:hypothetical protein